MLLWSNKCFELQVDIRLLGSGLGPHTQRLVSKKLSQIAARVHNVNSAAEEPQAIEVSF